MVLIHDAARPVRERPALIDRTIDAAMTHGAAIAALQSRDTVKRVERRTGVIVETIPRETVYLAQTPQGFRREVLAAAVAAGRAGDEATDEAALAERAGYQVHVVDGDPGNMKITTADDVEAARQRMGRPAAAATWPCHASAPATICTGSSKGGRSSSAASTVPSDRGALAHSDGDVACHAATDAILGAASLGDIGRHFPDTDPKWKDADSLALLRDAARMVREQGYEIGNVDVTVILERPKIKDLIEEMRTRMAAAMDIDPVVRQPQRQDQRGCGRRRTW